MAKPVSLSNGCSWPTQKAAKQHFRDMLHRYENDEVINDAQDHSDLVALVERYDESIDDGAPKAGSGIDFFFRKLNKGEGWSSPGFWIRRIDGTETDFSFPTAVDARPKGDSADFYAACRAAVDGDLAAAKRRFFCDHPDKDEQGRVPCELTGHRISIDQAHMDHAYPTFNQIVLMFKAARGWAISLPPGVITPPGDAQTQASFIDPAVTEAFRDLHHSVAVLRVIEKRANLSLAGQQRVPKIKYPVKL